MILYEGGGSCLPCNAIWRPVETLPSLDEASRNHAYVLPDNSIWVLNHDGTGFVTADKSSIMVKSEDNSIVITKDGLVYNLELNTDIIERLKQSIDLSNKQDKLTAGTNISIDNNVISSTVQPYDDTDIKNRVALLENKPDNVVYTAGDGIEISSNNVISAVERLPIFVKSDTPTKIYSFRITPYTSMAKRDMTANTIVYNATINTPYQSGIMVAQDDLTREYQLSWQNLLTDYNVMSIMSATFNERQILNKTSFIRLDGSNKISFTVQDFDDGINVVSVANGKRPSKTQNNKEVSCAISWMRVDVTYYKIEKGEL
ncbi:hypothetical protein [Streptococcus hyointestinalis]|nr:hypothetical protein [Streptococcus hyointestinalis]